MNMPLEKIVIAVFIAAIIIATLQAIVKGAVEGVRTASSIMKGQPIEEVYRKDKEKQKRREQEEKAKLSSTLYKLTHPLVYANFLIENWLRKEAGKDE